MHTAHSMPLASLSACMIDRHLKGYFFKILIDGINLVLACLYIDWLRNTFIRRCQCTIFCLLSLGQPQWHREFAFNKTNLALLALIQEWIYLLSNLELKTWPMCVHVGLILLYFDLYSRYDWCAKYYN